MERAIQKFKSNVKYRTTEFPEKLFAHDFLAEEALIRMRFEDDWTSVRDCVRTFDELVPAYRADTRGGPAYDEGDPATGTQLLGKGKTLAGHEVDEAMQQLTSYLRRQGQEGWEGEHEDSPVLMSFTMAHKRGDEILWLVRHRRSRSRYDLMCVTRSSISPDKSYA